MNRIFSLGEVGRLLSIQAYRIAYAINTRQVPEASFKFLGKRCFTVDDIARVADHFGVSRSGTSATKGGAVATADSPISQA